MNIKKYQKLIFLILLLIIAGITLSVYQIILLNKAHSTFENYYAFRGCTKLLNKNDDFGTCQTNSGQNIKIVRFQNKWYLDGDFPCGFLCF